MRRGDFARGWEISDAVLRDRMGESCAHLPREQQWVWRGESIVGRHVLIRCHHGLGDTIQFIRYAPLVRRTAGRVSVCAQPQLLSLLRTVRGIDELLPLEDAEPDVDCEVEVESMELPHLFRSTTATLPAQVPYLSAQPAELADDGNLHVGLVWRSGDWVPQRSIPIELLLPLNRLNGVTLHILQRGPGLRERPRGFGVVSGADDIAVAAQKIASLDLLISVDSMPAHLAGALGVPTWTLLLANPDWRWMHEREDTPWYPTMRLFRQDRAGDWRRVAARVVAELRILARNRRVS